jgi:hypothetical protein
MMSHKPIEKRLNLRAELKRIKNDPLTSFLARAFPDTSPGSPRTRYEEAYYLYFRSMERVLEQVSTEVRYRKGPYYVRKYGGKYGPGQKKLAEKWRRLHPFLELDVSTSILHTHVLLDKVVALSRAFFEGPVLPSFNSFSDHKQIFVKRPNAISGHEKYSQFMREETGWFDIPIKFIRDKFFVHQGPKHMRFFSIGWEKDDNLTLNFFVLSSENGITRERLQFNPWRMSYDIESFLLWFGAYGLNACTQKANNALQPTPYSVRCAPASGRG